MPHLKVARLYRNRCGVWCYRLRSGERDQRVSLGTKDPLAAHVMAVKINEAVASARASGGAWRMGSKNLKLEDLNLDVDAIRRYEIDLSRDVFKADGPVDHERTLAAYALIGPHGLPLNPEHRSPAAAPPPAVLRCEMLSSVAEKWLAERAQKNGVRTVYMKKLHYQDFQRRIAKDVEIDSVNKAVLVGYKSACLAAGQKAKTIDNKLLSISDLFKYALAHGLYTASAVSPVSGLFMQTK